MTLLASWLLWAVLYAAPVSFISPRIAALGAVVVTLTAAVLHLHLVHASSVVVLASCVLIVLMHAIGLGALNVAASVGPDLADADVELIASRGQRFMMPMFFLQFLTVGALGVAGIATAFSPR